MNITAEVIDRLLEMEASAELPAALADKLRDAQIAVLALSAQMIAVREENARLREMLQSRPVAAQEQEERLRGLLETHQGLSLSDLPTVAAPPKSWVH